MGLLDQIFGNADQTQALGLLGANMMAGNTANGFAQAQGLLAGADDRRLAAEYKRMQMENYKSEIEQRKAAVAKQQQIQGLLGSMFGAGGASAPQVSPGAFAPAVDGMGPTMPPSMSVQSAPGSRLGNLGIDQIAALHAAGGPNLMDAYKWVKDPLKLEPGSTYQDRATGKERFIPKVEAGIAPDANGFYNPLPNYAEAQASIEAAKARAVESAKAGFDLVRVVGADGAERYVPRSTVIGNQPQPNQQAPANRQTTIPPETQRAQDQDSIRILQEEVNKERSPQVRISLQRELDRMKGAQSRPGFPTPSLKSAEPSGFQASQSTAQRADAKAQEVTAETTARDIAEQRKNIVSAGFAAPTNIAKYQQLGKLLEGVDGGTLTATGTNIASAMNSLGIKIDKNLPNKEAAAALGNEMALQLRSPASGAGMPGAMSDKDREFLVGMIPNASQTAQGRKMLIDAQIAIAQRNQQVASFARNYEKKYGRLDNGFFEQMQAWSSANPMFGGK